MFVSHNRSADPHARDADLERRGRPRRDLPGHARRVHVLDGAAPPGRRGDGREQASCATPARYRSGPAERASRTTRRASAARPRRARSGHRSSGRSRSRSPSSRSAIGRARGRAEGALGRARRPDRVRRRRAPQQAARRLPDRRGQARRAERALGDRDGRARIREEPSWNSESNYARYSVQWSRLLELIDGKYQLVEIAGEGGMATVYKAVQKGAAGLPAHRRDQAHQARVPRAQELHRHVHRGGARRQRARAPEHRPGPRLRQRRTASTTWSWSGSRASTSARFIKTLPRRGHARRRGRWPSRSASARCAASAPPTSRRRARRHAGAGDPSRRVAAQRAARHQRRRQAVRLRPRARARSRRAHDRARAPSRAS